MALWQDRPDKVIVDTLVHAMTVNSDRCPSCGEDFAEFPEMRHSIEECNGLECTCYEIIGGHQMGCPFYDR